MSEEAAARPLRILFTEAAEAEVADAYQWLQTFGFDTAEKWLAGLAATLAREAELLGAVPLRRPLAPDAPRTVSAAVSYVGSPIQSLAHLLRPVG